MEEATRRFPRKYIFVTGGVMSSVGKGVATSALGVLLKRRGYRVSAVKYEGYLNVDAGTINPIEHGDPFLCADGTEADMDLGTYERFWDQDLLAHNFYTFGKVLKNVIDKERSMFYKGEDVEPIPHVRDEIVTEIITAGELDNADIVFTELGGTVGEPTNSMNAIYYEAIREMKRRFPGDVKHIHVGYVLHPEHLGEPKTKPTQISLRLLLSHGIPADFLVVRGKLPLDERRLELLARFSDLDPKHTINANHVDNIYHLPKYFADQDFDKTVLQELGLPVNDARSELPKFNVLSTVAPKQIAIVGKYFKTGDHKLTDAYFALIESIKHASWASQIPVKLDYISSEELEATSAETLLGEADGLIVPIGWGARGSEGKIQAIKYAREHKLPYLGLCFGMQLAAVEFARNVVGLADASSEELNPDTPFPVIHSIPFDPKYQVIKGSGVSMRLGSYDCVVKADTLTHDIYTKYPDHIKETLADGNLLVTERHRHRYEFNNAYRDQLAEKGLVFSGTSPDDMFVEMLELSRDLHPFFVATQAHPEYKSRPTNPHPMFLEFAKNL